MKKQDFFALVVLLAGTGLFCGLSYIWRDRFGYLPYKGFVWNLFLAWIPVGIAFLIRVSRMPFLLSLPLIGLWLLFFPNALYVLTDFEHMNISAHFWFNWAIVVSYVLTGVFAGFVSLAWIHSAVRAVLGTIIGWIFVLASIGLSGLGVYIGRFLRWNSWDMLTDPRVKFWEFRQVLKDPDALIHMVQLSAVFSAIFLFVYVISAMVPQLVTSD